MVAAIAQPPVVVFPLAEVEITLDGKAKGTENARRLGYDLILQKGAQLLLIVRFKTFPAHNLRVQVKGSDDRALVVNAKGECFIPSTMDGGYTLILKDVNEAE